MLVLPLKPQSPAIPAHGALSERSQHTQPQAGALRPPGRSRQDLSAAPGRERGTGPGRRREKGPDEVTARPGRRTPRTPPSPLPRRICRARLPQRSTAPHTHALHGGRQARPTRRAPAARGSWRPCPGPAPPWRHFESGGADRGGHGGTAAGTAQTSSPGAARI